MKKNIKATTALAPVPVVLVTVGDEVENNVITLAWVGVINSEPPMLSISVRPSRHSYALLERTGEFTVNLVTKELTRATDLCGVVSGRDKDKFALAHLTREKGESVSCPSVAESPVNIECKVVKSEVLGSHTVFYGRILNVRAEDRYLSERGALKIPLNELIAYSNGAYVSTGDKLGSFGYSVKK